MPVAKILDISHHQEDVQFGLLKRAGIEAVILKATEGIDYVDPTFADRVERARSVGLKVGAYHFMSSDSPQAQWSHFVKAVEKFRPLVLALDYEENEKRGNPNLYTLKTMVNLGLRDLGRHLTLYGSHMLIDELRKATCPKEVFDCPRWLARYSIFRPKLPCDIWQFSQTARMPGHSCRFDANVLVSKTYATVGAFWARQEI